MPEHHRGKKPPNAGREFPPQPLTRAELALILGAFSRRGSAGIRNAAMTSVMARSGLRLGETVRAPLGDLDLEARSLYVRFPKRDRRGRAHRRTVGIDQETALLLERWLARRRTLRIPRSAPLFCQIQGDRRGDPMAQSGYRESLKAAAQAVGIEKRVHPHGLRHTFAFQWVQDGGDLHELMVALGHRNVATTHTYTNHINPKQVLDRMRERDFGPAAAAPDLLSVIRAAVRAELAGGGPAPDLLDALG